MSLTPVYLFLGGVASTIVTSLIFTLSSVSTQKPISKWQMWVIVFSVLASVVGMIWTGAKVGNAYNKLYEAANSELVKLFTARKPLPPAALPSDKA